MEEGGEHEGSEAEDVAALGFEGVLLGEVLVGDIWQFVFWFRKAVFFWLFR